MQARTNIYVIYIHLIRTTYLKKEQKKWWIKNLRFNLISAKVHRHCKH